MPLDRPLLPEASLALVLSVLTLSLQAAAPAESVGALLLRVQEESAAPLVRYCGAAVPGQKNSLEAEYSRFRKRFRNATAPLAAQFKAKPELAGPASRDLKVQFDQMGAQSLAQFRTMDAREACSGLKSNLAKATEASIQKSMQSALAQFSAAVRQGR
jgi:hypothetical protein